MVGNVSTQTYNAYADGRLQHLTVGAVISTGHTDENSIISTARTDTNSV